LYAEKEEEQGKTPKGSDKPCGRGQSAQSKYNETRPTLSNNSSN